MTQPGRIASALALAFVCVIHVVASLQLSHRSGVDVDETEFLQGALRMARGERIYTDFAEHHPPFLFRALSWMAPKNLSDAAAIDAYVVRARLLSHLFGAIAVAAAAFALWRGTSTLYAPAIFIGILLGAPSLWDRAFSDVRGEPFALAFFWAGALLIIGTGDTPARRVTYGAIGVGLVAASCLINPKWPLASLALGLFFVISAARAGWPLFLRGMLIGSGIVVALLLLLVATVDPRQYVDFVFVQSRHMFDWWLTHAPPAFRRGPFFHCPIVLKPTSVVPAAAVLLVIALTVRGAYRNVRVVYGIVALLVATFLEIRFVYPYPILWVQYYILWGTAAAAVYALLPHGIVALVQRLWPNVTPVAKAVPVVATIIAILMAPDVLPLPGPDAMAVTNAKLATRLRPDDTVFVGMTYHPLGARDASYYWFGFGDFVPGALDFAKTPRGARILPPIREEDLPPCRLERGLDPHLRLVQGGIEIVPLPAVAACVERLRARGVLVETRAHNIFFVRRGAALQ